MDRRQSERLGRAFNASIYGMLGVPALLLGGLVTIIVRNARASARRDRDRSNPSPDSGRRDD